MLKRLIIVAAATLAVLAGVALPAAAQDAPEITYAPLVEGRNLLDSCRQSDNVLLVTVGPETFPLDVYTRAACVSTLATGRLSFIAYWESCKVLESEGINYPYAFYGNPAYTANNRLDCVKFLRGFHTGQLPPGPPA